MPGAGMAVSGANYLAMRKKWKVAAAGTYFLYWSMIGGSKSYLVPSVSA
jgi:hypothetical protein